MQWEEFCTVSIGSAKFWNQGCVCVWGQFHSFLSFIKNKTITVHIFIPLEMLSQYQWRKENPVMTWSFYFFRMNLWVGTINCFTA